MANSDSFNASPARVADFADIPVKVVGNAPVLLGEVAHVWDGFAEQANIVHVNGRRATYLAILKHADASTLAVVDATRDALPAIRAAAPEGLDLRVDFDQSVFVRGAVKGVVREAIISSMTREERADPAIINGSRRRRIAKGSGTTVADVNQLIKQFGEMQKLMKQMGGLAKAGRLPRVPGMRI